MDANRVPGCARKLATLGWVVKPLRGRAIGSYDPNPDDRAQTDNLRQFVKALRGSLELLSMLVKKYEASRIPAAEMTQGQMLDHLLEDKHVTQDFTGERE
jgi:hypothetical protein